MVLSNFQQQKLEILSNLCSNIDFSPKGSIDAPSLEIGKEVLIKSMKSIF